MPAKLTTRKLMQLLMLRPRTRKMTRPLLLPTPLQKQKRNQLTRKLTKNQQQKINQLKKNQLMRTNQPTKLQTARLQKQKPNEAHAAANATSSRNAPVSVGRN